MLDIYVHLLLDVSIAEEYCKRIYSNSSSPPPEASAEGQALDIYFILLEAIALAISFFRGVVIGKYYSGGSPRT